MSEYTPTIADLATVSSDNLAAFADAATTSDIVNVSTSVVSETPSFNSQQYEMAIQAKAVQAEHLNFVSQAGRQDHLNQIRTDLAPIVNQLQSIRLPDTQVNIDGRKIEVSSSIKQYANDLNQAKYNQMTGALLGRERMDRFKQLCTKANQTSKPALWLNQHITVECKKDYVFLLRRHNQDLIDKLLALCTPEIVSSTNQLLAGLLGHELFGLVKHIAESNQVPPYVVYSIVVDTLVGDYVSKSKPITSSSIWDSVTTPEDKPVRQALTAERAMEMRG